MMEKAKPVKRHDHVILVAGHNDVVVANRSARLGNVLHAAFVGSLDVVAKGEEGVGTERHTGLRSQEFLLFLPGQPLRLLGKEFLPSTIREHIHVILGKININGIVPVRTADISAER